jgi:hypothetical protein
MKLFLLRPIGKECDAHDMAQGFVVRAKNEDAARFYADKRHGDEGNAWLFPTRTTCEELLTKGEEGVILRDFNAG